MNKLCIVVLFFSISSSKYFIFSIKFCCTFNKSLFTLVISSIFLFLSLFFSSLLLSIFNLLFSSFILLFLISSLLLFMIILLLIFGPKFSLNDISPSPSKVNCLFFWLLSFKSELFPSSPMFILYIYWFKVFLYPSALIKLTWASFSYFSFSSSAVFNFLAISALNDWNFLTASVIYSISNSSSSSFSSWLFLLFLILSSDSSLTILSSIILGDVSFIDSLIMWTHLFISSFKLLFSCFNFTS